MIALTESDAKFAKELYLVFFKRHGIKNPTDMNCREKFEYAVEVGWDNFSLMQRARKCVTLRRMDTPTLGLTLIGGRVR